MKKGTTPIHTFKLPFDVNAINNLLIIYAQDDAEILQKKMVDCTLENDTVVCKLSQEDTFKFDCDKGPIQIQMRVLTAGGDALISEIKHVPIYKCLNEEVLA